MLHEVWEIITDAGTIGLFESEKEALKFIHAFGFKYMHRDTHGDRIIIDCYLDESLEGLNVTITNIRLNQKAVPNWYNFTVEKNRHLFEPANRKYWLKDVS